MTWIPLTYVYDTDVLVLIIQRVSSFSFFLLYLYSSYLLMPIGYLPYNA